MCRSKKAVLSSESVGAVTPIDVPLSGACNGVDDWTSDQDLNETLVGKFCMIKYDGKAYPGKIPEVHLDDDDAMIQCMTKVGENHYIWPLRT